MRTVNLVATIAFIVVGTLAFFASVSRDVGTGFVRDGGACGVHHHWREVGMEPLDARDYSCERDDAVARAALGE